MITGCEDYVLRTFTRDFTRIAPADELDVYEKQVKAAESAQQIDLDKLPRVEDMHKIPGKKDGEMKVFKKGTNPEVYKWIEGARTWEKIGDV